VKALTAEKIALINRSAVVNPLAMYPLSQLAADLGRAGLIRVELADGQDVTGLATRSKWDQVWFVRVTEAGWAYVTDPEALDRRRRELALRRLRDDPAEDGLPSFSRSRLRPM
jgi:hypothetical protein